MRFGIREIVFMLVLLAMPVAAYMFVFEPRNAQITDARAEIEAKQHKLQQLEAATKTIDDLGTEIDRLAEAVSVFEQRLPVQQEVEVILKEVWELAARNSLTPRSVRTDKPVAMARYSELPIRMEIVGDFEGFYEFMLQLEKLPRITRMPQIRLKRLVNNDHGQMQANVVLSIFFEANESNAARRS